MTAISCSENCVPGMPTVGSVTLTSGGYVNTATYVAPGPDYAITPSAATGGSGLGNYAIGYVAGNLHVNQRTLTITASGQSCGSAPPRRRRSCSAESSSSAEPASAAPYGRPSIFHSER